MRIDERRGLKASRIAKLLSEISKRQWLGLLLGLVVLVYARHFDNDFHFDDGHTIVENPAIRSLSNWPRLLCDGTAFSILPSNQGWRPILSLSLAFDYWLGGGLKVWVFHLDSFCLFLLLLAAIYSLYSQAIPRWALAGTAIFALHPVAAETVNYLIQRGDLLATLGCTAGVALYGKKSRWYLLPFLAAGMSKPNGVVFPLLLGGWMLFIERKWKWSSWGWVCALAAALTLLHRHLIPPSFAPGALSREAYWWTQPYVICSYVVTLFYPTGLVADTDLTPFASPWMPWAVAGYGGLLALLAVMVWAARRRSTQPITFGLIWFFSGLLPTSLVPLAEVTNDHRMFLPFVGLVLATCHGLSLLGWRWLKPALALALGVSCCLTYQRNQVWDSEESLWREVTLKAPGNGRGWMNYGLALMKQGRYPEAASCFREAEKRAPNYPLVYVNLGVLEGSEGHAQAARAAFAQAQRLAPNSADSYYFEARWLQKDQPAEALGLLERALRANPDHPPTRQLLLELGLREKSWRTLRRWRESFSPQERQTIASQEALELQSAQAMPPSPARHVQLSFVYYKLARYSEAAQTAREGLKQFPDSAELHNNLASAHLELKQWDLAAQAATRAVELRPDWVLAQNNLRLAQHKGHQR